MRATTYAFLLTLMTASVFGQCPPATSGNWCSGSYQYDGMGNIKTIGADTYVYDQLGRLKSGTADVQRTGRVSRQNYDYDAFGNRTNVYRDSGSVDCLGGCELSPPLTVSTSTNHITNHTCDDPSRPCYDAAGNLIRIDSASYSYDAAGMLVRAIATDDRQYVYTADDERIASKNGLSWTWTVRGIDQKVLREFTSAEVNGQPTSNRVWAKDYVWRDGQLLASVAPGANGNVVQHYHLDHLGTPRVVSNAATGMRMGEHAYYPFGAELSITPQEQPAELMKFTGHERDVQGNDPHTLDLMHARYEMATLGRFMSLDSHPGKPEDPQTWNAYAYVGNNPITYDDPSGNERLPLRMYRNPPGGAAGLRGAAHLIKVGLDVAAPIVATVGLAFEVYRGVVSPSQAVEQVEQEVQEVAPAVEADIAALQSDAELSARATEIQSALPEATQRFTTTAVARVTNADGTTGTLVGSSERVLRPAQRAILRANETAVSGTGHAEATIIDAAAANGQKVQAVAASRPICANCAARIQQAGARAASVLKKLPPAGACIDGKPDCK